MKGLDVENYVADKFQGVNLREIEQHYSWGVDIVVKTMTSELKIEVKSAQRFVNNGNRKPRSGKFSFIPNNLDKPDYFAFVICNWNGKRTTYWVKASAIRAHFNNRKIKSHKTRFTLGIPTLLTRIQKIDFSEVIHA